MLRGDADTGVEARKRAQGVDHREQLDRFRPGAEDEEDFRHDYLVPCLGPLVPPIGNHVLNRMDNAASARPAARRAVNTPYWTILCKGAEIQRQFGKMAPGVKVWQPLLSIISLDQKVPESR
jgi:hypothetical protein